MCSGFGENFPGSPQLFALDLSGCFLTHTAEACCARHISLFPRPLSCSVSIYRVSREGRSDGGSCGCCTAMCSCCCQDRLLPWVPSCLWGKRPLSMASQQTMSWVLVPLGMSASRSFGQPAQLGGVPAHSCGSFPPTALVPCGTCWGSWGWQWGGTRGEMESSARSLCSTYSCKTERAYLRLFLVLFILSAFWNLLV